MTVAFAVPHFERDIRGRVMIPAHARPAHHRLRQKLAEIAAWNETCPYNRLIAEERREERGEEEKSEIRNPKSEIPNNPQISNPPRPSPLGIITSGVTFMHVREAAPDAAVLKLGLTYPLAARKNPPVRRRRRALPDRRRGRSVPLRANPRGGNRSRAEARNVPLRRVGRGAGAKNPRQRHLARSRSCRRASRRRCASVAPIASRSSCSESSIASSPATSAATRSARCRPSREWTPNSAWAPASAWAWGCATCCPRSRPGGW